MVTFRQFIHKLKEKIGALKKNTKLLTLVFTFQNGIFYLNLCYKNCVSRNRSRSRSRLDQLHNTEWYLVRYKIVQYACWIQYVPLINLSIMQVRKLTPEQLEQLSRHMGKYFKFLSRSKLQLIVNFKYPSWRIMFAAGFLSIDN